MKKKVCKRCKMFTDATECPNCHGNQFTNNWKGRLFIVDVKQSGIAKKIGVEMDGEYAIKAR